MNVDMSRIAVRAYYHWQNRSGKQWWDDFSNWIQAEEEERELIMELLNFAHGMPRPGRWRIGPFELSIESSHVASLALLHRNQEVKFELVVDRDTGATAAVRHFEGNTGSWQVTAFLRLVDEGSGQAMLAMPGSNLPLDWDFRMLASFLSGRRVCSTNEMERYRPDVVGEYVVMEPRTLQALVATWKSRHSLLERGLLPAFWNYIWSNDTYESGPKASLLSAALNVLYDESWSRTGSPTVEKELQADLFKRLWQVVENDSVLSEIQKNEIRASLKNTLGAVSAPTKIKHLLLEHALIDDKDNNAWERIRLVNLVRNSFVHRGVPPKIKDMTDERCGTLWSAVVGGVIPALVRYVLSVALGLGNITEVLADSDSLKEFFCNGIWNGQDVYQESFEEYINRAEQEWMNPFNRT